jgi:hypothetical protein
MTRLQYLAGQIRAVWHLILDAMKMVVCFIGTLLLLMSEESFRMGLFDEKEVRKTW